MRSFLKLSYDGGNYHGWQRQPDHYSVQQCLEENLHKLLGHKVHCHGCGRTDAGVHASKFYAHLDLETYPAADFIYTINKMLPDDIAIQELIPVAPESDAQLDATLRTYEYHLHTEKNPFLSRHSSYYSLDENQLVNLLEATKLIESASDFRSLCRQPELYKNTICEIKEVNFKISPQGKQAVLSISSNRFLRGMIRLIVARLIEVALKEITMKEWAAMLKAEQEMKYKHAAYPQGLRLTLVEYPFI